MTKGVAKTLASSGFDAIVFILAQLRQIFYLILRKRLLPN